MSFFESASLVFISDFAAASASAVSGSGTNTGKAYNIKPIEELGSELIVNGDFATDSDWNFTNVGGSNGWRIADGRAICDTVNPSNGRNLNSSTSLVSGKSYKVTLDILQSTDELEILVGSTLFQNAFPIGTTIGASYIIDSSQHTGGTFSFYGGSSDLQEIDNVSVKEVITSLADFDFERGSDITATRVNSSGLIEKGRGNFLLQSNQFDTTWTQYDATPTSGENGYNGSTDAWKLSSDSAGTGRRISQVTTPKSGVVTFSVYVKAGTYSGSLYLRVGGDLNYRAYFDLSNGTTDGGTNLLTSKVTPVGNDGWYRYEATWNLDTGSTFEIRFLDPTITGDYIYIQDAQVEQGLVATDYIETTTEPLRAGILEDEPRFDYHNSASATPNTCPSLLLEPGRDNLIGYSEAIKFGISTNECTQTITSETNPSGNDVSYLASAIDSNNDQMRYEKNGLSPGSYFLSTFVKGDGNVNKIRLRGTGGGATTGNVYWDVAADGTISLNTSESPSGVNAIAESYGNGWYRIGFEETYDGSSTSRFAIYPSNGDVNASIYVWGVQWEQGSYPTSYIPTYGTAATRGADDADVIDNLTIGNGSEFGVYYEIDVERIPRQSSNPFIQIQFTTANGRIGIKGASDALANYIDLNGTTDFSESFSPLDMGAGIIKFFINYSSGTGDFYLNGTKYTGVISGPTSGCEIDSVYLVGAAYKLKAKQLLIFPTSLSDTDCEILTGATTYSSFAAMASALNYTVYE